MAPLWYAHPDGWLRRVGTGELGPSWAGPSGMSAAQREALVFGEYVPNATNTGLLPGTTPASLTPEYGTGGLLSAPPGATYTDTIFWCDVRMPRSGTGPTFTNCVFAGQDPDTIANGGPGGTYEYGADSQGIRAWDSDHPQWTVKHSLWDAKLWFDPAANPPGGARTGDADFKLRSSAALRGGRGSILWCEVRNYQDGLSIFHDATNPADTGHMHIKGTWIHDVIYYQGAGHWQPEGTHSDAIQFHKGLNVEVVGNRIEVPANAGIQLQLEQSTRLLENVTISRNIFEGIGANGYGINHGLKEATDFTGGAIHDNVFIGLPGKAIIARTQYLWAYSGNRVAAWAVEGESYTDTGAVTISNGGA